MGVVDRTPEFCQILRDLARESGAPFKDLNEQQVNQEQSVLNLAAGELGKEIHQASLKVQELRKMTKKKKVFDDKTHDIQVLIVSVREDIQNLKQKIDMLESKVKGAGPNETCQVHSMNMLTTLKTRLIDVKNEFRDALEDRTKTMQSQDKRRQGLQPNRFANRQWPNPSANPDDPEAGGAGQAFSQLYTNSRAEAVQSVQRTLGELVTMFQKTAVMVTAQEEMVQRIDQDIDDTTDNMNAAQESLLKYFHHISSNRALIMKVFGIIIFFVVFFVIFIAD
jgi:syntaxin 5